MLDHTPIAERRGASAEIEALKGCHDRSSGVAGFLRVDPTGIKAALQGEMNLVYQRGERTPWAKTVGNCQQLQQVADGLWSFLEIDGVDPTNSAAERALRHWVIQLKINNGVHVHLAKVRNAAAACPRSR